MQPASAEDAEKTTVMNKVDDHVAATSNKLSDISKEYNDLQGEALAVLGRRLAVCIEDFTRDLELLDSLSLAESVDTIKSRRKNIVVKIQGLLKEADALQNDITDLRSKSDRS